MSKLAKYLAYIAPIPAFLGIGSVLADTVHEAAGLIRPAAGKQIFEAKCSQCHDRPQSGAPAKVILAGLTASTIYAALTTGRMRGQGGSLADQERRDVAEYLSQGKLVNVRQHRLRTCTAKFTYDSRHSPVGIGWGIDPENTRLIPAKQAGLTISDLPDLQLKWAFAFGDVSSATAQPLIAGGAVFVGSADGTVYSLSSRSGCAYWTYKARAQIQGGIVLKESGAKSPGLFFADRSAHVYALDATSGQLLWDRKMDEHPAAIIMGTPALLEGRLYVPVISMEENAGGAAYPCCTFRGSLVAVDASTGEIIWKRYTIPSPAVEHSKNAVGVPQYGPSGAGLWSAPTVDSSRDLIYFTTGNGYSEPGDNNSDAVFAVDLASGEVRWRTQTFTSDNWNSWDYVCRHIPKLNSSPGCPSLKKPGPDVDFTTSPVLVHGEHHKDVLVAGRKDGTTFGLDPDTGIIEWATRTSSNPDSNAGSLNYGLMAEGERIFVPSAGTTAPNAATLKSTEDDGLFALNAFTGVRLWSARTQADCDRKAPCTGITFAPIGFPGAVFAGDTNGYVRAYDTATGKVLWRFDTAREFTTVNGEKTKGGAISRNSIMVGDGMLYVGSGSFVSPGNVLLAFSAARSP